MCKLYLNVKVRIYQYMVHKNHDSNMANNLEHRYFIDIYMDYFLCILCISSFNYCLDWFSYIQRSFKHSCNDNEQHLRSGNYTNLWYTLQSAMLITWWNLFHQIEMELKLPQ